MCVGAGGRERSLTVALLQKLRMQQSLSSLKCQVATRNVCRQLVASVSPCSVKEWWILEG